MYLNIQIKKADWIGHVMRRNCYLKHIIDEKVESRMDRRYVKARKKTSGANV
jgi:hypothetical protein